MKLGLTWTSGTFLGTVTGVKNGTQDCGICDTKGQTSENFCYIQSFQHVSLVQEDGQKCNDNNKHLSGVDLSKGLWLQVQLHWSGLPKKWKKVPKFYNLTKLFPKNTGTTFERTSSFMSKQRATQNNHWRFWEGYPDLLLGPKVFLFCAVACFSIRDEDKYSGTYIFNCQINVLFPHPIFSCLTKRPTGNR